MSTTWRNDWTVFVDALGVDLRRGAAPDELRSIYGMQTVRWSGVLREKLLGDFAPVVTVELADARIDLGEPGVVSLGNQSVAVSDDAVGAWDQVPLGNAVTFTALLGRERSLFPPIQVVRLPSGRTVVMIDLIEARPIDMTLAKTF